MNKTNISNIDLNLLTVFDAVMQCGNTTHAAKRLGLTQPAISHALKRLRVVLDDPLFVRTPRGMTPTPTALELAPAIDTMLRQVEALFNREKAFIPENSTRQFVVGLSDYASFVVLPRLLEMLALEAPAVSLLVKSTCHSEGMAMLEEDAAELIIGNFPTMPPHLQQEELFRESFLCAGRSGHPAFGGKLTTKRYVGLEHLQISTRGEPQGYVDAVMAKKGLTRTIKVTVPHFLTAPFLLQSSDLVATEPRRLLEPMREILGLSIAEPPFAIPCFRVTQNWHSRYDCDGGHVWLRNYVKKVVENLSV